MKYEKSCGCVVIDDNKVLLIKHNAGHWDLPKGHMEDGETEIETAIREIKEETNIDVEVNENYRYVTEYSPKEDVLKEVVYFIASKKTDKCIPQETEVQIVEWVELNEAIKRITFDNTREILKKAIKDLDTAKIPAYKYIGKNVKVKIDRPLGSKHPKFDLIYPVNYGYVPNTISGDGEELDCYILGISKPIEEFEGECIAVIHRINDNDDKLIIVPNGESVSDIKIRELTQFQEQYFESEIIR